MNRRATLVGNAKKRRDHWFQRRIHNIRTMACTLGGLGSRIVQFTPLVYYFPLNGCLFDW